MLKGMRVETRRRFRNRAGAYAVRDKVLYHLDSLGAGGPKAADPWQNLMALFAVMLLLCRKNWNGMVLFFSKCIHTMTTPQGQCFCSLKMFLTKRKTKGDWQVMGEGRTAFRPLWLFLRVTKRLGFCMGEGQGRFLFPAMDRDGACRGSGFSPFEPGSAGTNPSCCGGSRRKTLTGGSTRTCSSACCGRAVWQDEADSASMWTLHCGRVGAMSQGDELSIDRPTRPIRTHTIEYCAHSSTSTTGKRPPQLHAQTMEQVPALRRADGASI